MANTGKSYVRKHINGGYEEFKGINEPTAGSEGELIAYAPNGKLPTAALPDGVGPDAENYVAFENLAAGDVVTLIYDTTVTPNAVKVRKADALTLDRMAVGVVLNNVTAGAAGLVYRNAIVTGAAGLTPSRPVFASVTPGAVSSTVPIGDGQIRQVIGRAISPTAYIFNPENDYLIIHP